jgi:hypothetical protein
MNPEPVTFLCAPSMILQNRVFFSEAHQLMVAVCLASSSRKRSMFWMWLA